MTPQVVHQVDLWMACYTCCSSQTHFLQKALCQMHQEMEIYLYRGCPRRNRQTKVRLLR